MQVSEVIATVKALKKSSPALQAILTEAGLSQVDAFLIAAMIDAVDWEGLTGDDVAGALLRSKCQSNRAAYREGYEEAAVVLSGTRQVPLVTPWDKD